MTTWSRTIGYCFQEQYNIVFPVVFANFSSETGYRNANFFLNRLWRFGLKNRHFYVKLHSTAPPRYVYALKFNSYNFKTKQQITVVSKEPSQRPTIPVFEFVVVNKMVFGKYHSHFFMKKPTDNWQQMQYVLQEFNSHNKQIKLTKIQPLTYNIINFSKTEDRNLLA